MVIMSQNQPDCNWKSCKHNILVHVSIMARKTFKISNKKVLCPKMMTLSNIYYWNTNTGKSRFWIKSELWYWQCGNPWKPSLCVLVMWMLYYWLCYASLDKYGFMLYSYPLSTLLLNRQLGKCHKAFLCQGSFGFNTKCTNTETDKAVAIKVFKNHPEYLYGKRRNNHPLWIQTPATSWGGMAFPLTKIVSASTLNSWIKACMLTWRTDTTRVFQWQSCIRLYVSWPPLRPTWSPWELHTRTSNLTTSWWWSTSNSHWKGGNDLLWCGASCVCCSYWCLCADHLVQSTRSHAAHSL